MTDRVIFAVVGARHAAVAGNAFTMVTYDQNELLAPMSPQAMITIPWSADCDTSVQEHY